MAYYFNISSHHFLLFSICGGGSGGEPIFFNSSSSRAVDFCVSLHTQMIFMKFHNFMED